MIKRGCGARRGAGVRRPSSGGKVYADMIANTAPKALLKAPKSEGLPTSVVYTDSLGRYGDLDVSGFKQSPS